MDEELIAKLMFGIGRSRVDRSAFNLFAGCCTQWAFFETCTLPDPVPDFALPTMLSRSLSEQHSMSWKKVILKLSEALQDTTLSDVAMLRAMLACCILITLETEEVNLYGSVRVSDERKQLCQKVLSCEFPST